ncbi:MAG: CRISPR-associated helicase/endonuclease Cas3 [Rhodospirillales bacterium]
MAPTAVHDKVLAGLVAYAIAGHHAGLADWYGSESSLTERLERFDRQSLDPAWREEVSPQVHDLAPSGRAGPESQEEASFAFGFLCRMIFSCLVDADFKDTEKFYAALEGRKPDRTWPSLGERLDDFIARLDRRMARFAKPRQGEALLQADRAAIHAQVRAKAQMEPGLFTLTVPTGGGKTLTSLGFALDHARAHGLRRVIYAIPFTSIIDQTASQFREILGDDAVLEHHSALEETPPGDESRQGPSKLRLAMEDWAAPVVVTTNVQLFESLFAARPARCRKLHNIAGSVIVLDEAQALPLPLLAPCLWALRELTQRYGCSVVLCTATQPALDKGNFETGGPLAVLPLAGRELAPDPQDLARRFRRVTLHSAGALDDEDLSAALAERDQGLMIVNSRAHALALYRAARAAGLVGLIHLSTRQHAEDRRTLLAEIKTRLDQGAPCRLVATSLVEAGVDLDFPCVWRAEAGLEQIVQAAGRCNREGKRPPEESPVTVFAAPDWPAPRDLAEQAKDFGRVRDAHGEDLLSLAAIENYFDEVYWRVDRDVDKKRILDLFRVDRSGFEGDFRTAAERFRMIEEGGVPIVVPNAETEALLAALDAGRLSPRAVARRLQTRLVQIPERARATLLADGQVRCHAESRYGDQFVVLTDTRLYSGATGLVWEEAGELPAEGAVI